MRGCPERPQRGYLVRLPHPQPAKGSHSIRTPPRQRAASDKREPFKEDDEEEDDEEEDDEEEDDEEENDEEEERAPNLT